jgi:hypothetical protein
MKAPGTPEPDGENIMENTQTKPVLTSAELTEALVQAWSAALGGAIVAPDDNIFELGGHSMLIARVAAEVRETLRVDIPFLSFFEFPTARGLAAEIDTSADRLPTMDLIPATAPDSTLDVRLDRACTTQEHRLLFNREMGDGRTQPMSYVYKIEGDLDVPRLQRGLRELVRRHDALRMVFPRHADMRTFASSVDADAADWPLTEVSLAALPADERDAAAQEELIRFCNASFDLERGPLTAALLLRLDATTHVLALSLDHLVCDGASFSILMDDLSRITGGSAGGDERPAPSFAAYAALELARLQSPVGDALVRYWQRDFDEHGMFPPRFRPTPALASDVAATGPSRSVSLVVPEDVARLIPAAARAISSTPFIIYLASVLSGLSRMVESDWIGTAFMEAGRRHTSASGMVGNLAHELHAWCRVPPGANFRELVTHVGERAAEAVSHSLPLWWMVRRYRSGVGAAQSFDPSQLSGRFTVPWLYFSCDDIRFPTLALDGVTAVPYPRRTEIPHMRTPVTIFTVARRSDQTTLTCDFAASGYHPDAVHIVVDHAVKQLTTLVAAIVGEPAIKR